MRIKNLTERRQLKAKRALESLGRATASNAAHKKLKGDDAVLAQYIDAKKYGFQLPSIKAHVAAYRAGQKHRLEGSDMGAGKTFIALAVCKLLGRRPFIVCPKNVRKKWKEAAAYFELQTLDAVNYEKLTRGNTEWGSFTKWDLKMNEWGRRKAEYAEACAQGKKDAFIDPRRPMRQADDGDFDYEFKLPDDAFIIFDESHRMKGVESLNAELLIAAVRKAAEANSKLQTMEVSASAACSPADMRALGYALGLHSLNDFMLWAKMNGCVEGQWGNIEFVGGEEMLSELHSQFFENNKLGCRIRVAELPKGMFPETQIEAEAYDMGEDEGKIATVYREMEKELILAQENAAMAKHPLTILLRARQKVELLKVPTFVEMIEDAQKDGMSALCFVNFKETLFALSKRLARKKLKEQFHPQLYWGGNKRDREIALRNFQENKENLLLLNIAAGAESIDCHDLSPGGKHPRFSIISPSWSALKMHQATGRPHRAGGTSNSIQRIVYCAGYPEANVCQKVREKLRNMQTLNDGDFIPDHLKSFLAPYMKQIIEADNASE